MRNRTKWIAAFAVVALIGGGALAVQAAQDDESPLRGLFGHHPPQHQPFWEVCDQNITVGECKEQLDALREERADAMYERCVEENGQEFCDEKRAEMEENGPRVHSHPHGHPRGPGGPGGAGGPGEQPEDAPEA